MVPGHPVPPRQLQRIQRLRHAICSGLRCPHMLQFRQATHQAFGSFDNWGTAIAAGVNLPSQLSLPIPSAGPPSSAQVCRGDRGTIRFSLRPSVAVPLTLSDQLLGLPLSPFPLEYAKSGIAPASSVLPSSAPAPTLTACEEGYCCSEHRSALQCPGLEAAQRQGTSCWKALWGELSRTSCQRTRLLLSRRRNWGHIALLQSTMASRGNNAPPICRGTAERPVFLRQPAGPAPLTSISAALEGRSPSMVSLR